MDYDKKKPSVDLDEDANRLQGQVDEYFKTEEPKNWAYFGLALACGIIYEDMVAKYKTGLMGERQADIIRRACNKISYIREKKMANNDNINAVAGIFLLKQDKMDDKRQLEISGGLSLAGLAAKSEDLTDLTEEEEQAAEDIA